MKSKAIGSSGKIRPILPVFVHKEMLQRHNSMDSFSNMSIGDVSGALVNNGQLSPSDPEKKLDYYPNLSYGALSSSGGTKVNDDSLRLSSFPSSAASLNSSASSVTYPTPVRTRQDSAIEISSVHRDSLFVEPTNPPTTTNSPSESSEPQPQPTNHSAVWLFFNDKNPKNYMKYKIWTIGPTSRSFTRLPQRRYLQLIDCINYYSLLVIHPIHCSLFLPFSSFFFLFNIYTFWI